MRTKPRILVDMDGPLAAFDEAVWRDTQDLDWPEGYDVAHPTHRFSTDVLSKEHRAIARARIETSGFFENIPVVPGAVEAFHRLAEVADVWICTKPLEANPTCRDEKAAWVGSVLGWEWEKRLIITPDKSMVVGEALIDDAPKKSWLQRATWVPVIFPRPYNGSDSEWDDLPRWGWDDPIDDLMVIIGW